MLVSNPFLSLLLILMLDIIFVLFILDGYWTIILGHELEVPIRGKKPIPSRHLGFYLLAFTLYAIPFIFLQHPYPHLLLLLLCVCVCVCTPLYNDVYPKILYVSPFVSNWLSNWAGLLGLSNWFLCVAWSGTKREQIRL